MSFLSSFLYKYQLYDTLKSVKNTLYLLFSLSNSTAVQSILLYYYMNHHPLHVVNWRNSKNLFFRLISCLFQACHFYFIYSFCQLLFYLNVLYQFFYLIATLLLNSFHHWFLSWFLSHCSNINVSTQILKSNTRVSNFDIFNKSNTFCLYLWNLSILYLIYNLVLSLSRQDFISLLTLQYLFTVNSGQRTSMWIY